MKQKRIFPEFLKIAVRPHHDTILPFAFPINGSMIKYIYDAPLISLLEEKLAFRPQLLEPADGQYGHILADGNWTGLVGMVQREEADLAIGQLSVTGERARVVDFSQPYLYSSITFITDKPQYLPDKYAMMRPFTPSVWIAVIISLILVQCMSCVLEVKSDSSQRLCLNSFASLLQQPVNFKLRKLATKVLISSWVVGATLLAMSYKNVLLSFLTIPSLTGVRNIRELAKVSEEHSFKCSSYAGTDMYTHALDSGDESWRKIAKCLTRSKMYTDDVESFIRPTNYKKAYVGNKFYLKSWHKTYFISEDTFFTDFLSIAVRKTFCCKKTLDETIHKIAAFGILQKFEKDKEFFLALDKGHFGIKEHDAIKKISLKEFSTALVLLFIGNCSAFVVFVTEILIGRRQKLLKETASSKRRLRHRSRRGSISKYNNRRLRKLENAQPYQKNVLDL